MIRVPYMVAGSIRYRPAPPERDWQYLRYIRTYPCVVCTASGRKVEAAHVGPHGLGQKASDLQSIPLCSRHHRTGQDSLHKLGPVKFQATHRVDFAALTTMFQAFYRDRKK